MRGFKFYTPGAFKLKNCRKTYDTAAVKIAAGEQMIDINEQVSLKNLTILSGGAGSVGIGGFYAGGGHGAISPIFGLGADQILEIELVTPGGDFITANECQNEDIFWAIRGVSFISVLLGKNTFGTDAYKGWPIHIRYPDGSDGQSLPCFQVCDCEGYFRCSGRG